MPRNRWKAAVDPRLLVAVDAVIDLLNRHTPRKPPGTVATRRAAETVIATRQLLTSVGALLTGDPSDEFLGLAVINRQLLELHADMIWIVDRPVNIPLDLAGYYESERFHDSQADRSLLDDLRDFRTALLAALERSPDSPRADEGRKSLADLPVAIAELTRRLETAGAPTSPRPTTTEILSSLDDAAFVWRYESDAAHFGFVSRKLLYNNDQTAYASPQPWRKAQLACSAISLAVLVLRRFVRLLGDEDVMARVKLDTERLLEAVGAISSKTMASGATREDRP
jgi:hypothetical protein